MEGAGDRTADSPRARSRFPGRRHGEPEAPPSSLEHLLVDTIDSYVLHGPSTGRGLAAVDLEVWGAMEELRLVARLQRTPAQVVFRFAQRVGMLPLTGTTKVGHMREDLEAERLELSEEDVRLVETIA